MAFVLLACAAILLAGGSTSAQEEAPGGPSRPDIILIVADDMAEGDLRSGAMPRTQELLVGEGVTFSEAHVTYSLCCPSRATILRGQYAHNTRVLDNSPAGPVPGAEAAFRSRGLDRSTIATWLDGAGYHTGHVGKYMNGYDGSYRPPGWDRWHTLYGAFHEDRTVDDGGGKRRYAAPVEDVLASRTARFLRDAPAGKPVYLQVGSHAPHTPNEYGEEYANLYPDRKAPRYPSFNEADVSDKPGWVRDHDRLTPEEIEAIDASYRDRLRALRELDDLVDAVVTALRASGRLDNTYVVFTSDNGWLYGEHRLSGKWNQFENATHVPLVIRGPGVPKNATRSLFALNTDLAPTIADWAGVPAPAFVDGRPLGPLLSSDRPTSWRTRFLVESWHDPAYRESPPNLRGVRTPDHYYGEYPDSDETELYDYRTDPHELRSLHRTADPRLIGDLDRKLTALQKCRGAGCRAAEGE